MHRRVVQPLIEARLGRPLAEYIAEKRGAEVAWRTIAAELAQDTDGIIVSYETLRAWFGEQSEQVPA